MSKFDTLEQDHAKVKELEATLAPAAAALEKDRDEVADMLGSSGVGL